MDYRNLISKLHGMGYEEARAAGNHVVMRNSRYDSTIVLPSGRKSEIVRDYVLSAVKKNIVEKGVISIKELDRMLRE